MPNRTCFAAVLSFALISAEAAGAAQDRILEAVDANRVAVLHGQVHPKALPQFDRGLADPELPIAYASVYLKPAPELEAFLADQQNPSSPDYHRWLTPEQFGERFGAGVNDIDKITSWLRSQGLTVDDIARGRQFISFSGSARQVGHAFGTEIHRYAVDGAMHFANASDVLIPAAFTAVVSGLRGLNDFRMKPLYRKAGLLPDLNSGGHHFLAPDDIATIYNISPLYQAGIDGTGQKIAVMGQTDLNLADIRSFRKSFGLPAADPQVLLYGADPGSNPDELVEADLDVEISGAIARGATIVYVNSSDVSLSALYAVDRNVAPVMTFSYGQCELQSDEALRSVAQQANAQGITWVVSSGDAGAATCDVTSDTPQASKGATLSYPSSIPEITAVGGTEFNEGAGNYWDTANGATRASVLSYIPERAWNDSALENSIVGGGGGPSAFFAKPAWQTGPGVPKDGARDVPDISFAASADHDGFAVVSSGNTYVVGGTSVSSPLFAGIVALLNQKLHATGVGNINPVLYRMAQTTTDVFHDIVVGDNMVACTQGSPNCVNGQLGYAAGPGYDMASGLGSANVANLVNEWNAGSVSATSLSTNRSSVAPGDSVVLTASVTSSGGVPSGSITFVANDASLGTVALSGGTAALTAPGAALVGGSGVVAAIYSGDTVFAPSTGSVSVALKLTTASYVVPSVFPTPVYASGGVWPVYLTLVEKAGLGTTLNALTVNGVSYLNLVRRPALQAKSTTTLFIPVGNVSAPVDVAIHLGGMDVGGTAWVQDLVVPFLAELPSLSPSIGLSAAPATVQQNPAADASCQWQQQITVEEQSGFGVALTRFTVGGSSLSTSISKYFGTTRLAPFGSLTATICTGGVTAPVLRNISVSGTAEDGETVSALLSGTLAAPASTPATFTGLAGPIRLSDSVPLPVNLNFTNTAPQWTVSVSPAALSKWLKVSAVSGSGPGTLTLTASAAGLSNGVYTALLTVSATNSVPQSIRVPVTLVVGGSAAVSIAGLGNAASGTHIYAPGALVAVYGNNLAPSSASAAIQPLPLNLAGVSVTVNGVSAPLWFVSPGQMNIQIPYETTAGTAILGVNNNGQVASFAFEAAPAGPGVFAANGSIVLSTGTGAAKAGQTIAGFITGDGDVSPTLASGATAASGTFPQSRLPVVVTVGGEVAKIAFDGIVTGLIGVTQLNFVVPADLPAGVVPVVVTVGGVAAAPVNLTITK